MPVKNYINAESWYIRQMMFQPFDLKTVALFFT